jgi:peptidyl-dipeptidase Dcp
MTRASNDNPLLTAWTAPHELPPFGEIRPEHFLPAFAAGMTDADAEVAAIAADPARPTFDNTIVALERSGEARDRVSRVFFNLTGAHTSPELQKIERDIGPKLTAHRVAIYQNMALFARVDALMQNRAALGLTGEQNEVLERYHRAFVKSGAKLDDAGRARLKAIAERATSLSIQFGQNVLADEQAFVLVLPDDAATAGLPAAIKSAAAETARAHGHDGKHAITLARSSIEPFLQYAARRDLRETAHKAWISRGANGGKTDNRALMAELLKLRAESARLLGFKNFAESSLEFSMAKTPAAVRKLLMDVWPAARSRASEERADLQKAVAAEGANFAIAAWDWRYYSEKVRKAKFDLDEADIKPYLQLDSMIAAAFDCATRLFGLTFEEKQGYPVYHPDVRVFEVKREGRHVGIFLGDYFARPSKRSGAWMSSFRAQQRLSKPGTPVIVNVLNFAKGAPGQPALLSMDDARTLFHEFGHGLHGLLSNVTYPCVSGTSVTRDFVELPSQLYEHWLGTKEVLQKFARHATTGVPMPETLIDRLKAARNFNQGFSTVEYLASALVDLDLHVLENADGIDVDWFETETLSRLGMPAEIGMRHRIPHFQHITGGYAAGYYSYLWSEVLDADAFRAFEETGDVFDAGTAKRLQDHIYAAGGKQRPDVAYLAFRGRLPAVDALLEKRGLKSAT